MSRRNGRDADVLFTLLLARDRAPVQCIRAAGSRSTGSSIPAATTGVGSDVADDAARSECLDSGSFHGGVLTVGPDLSRLCAAASRPVGRAAHGGRDPTAH